MDAMFSIYVVTFVMMLLVGSAVLAMKMIEDVRMLRDFERMEAEAELVHRQYATNIKRAAMEADLLDRSVEAWIAEAEGKAVTEFKGGKR